LLEGFVDRWPKLFLGECLQLHRPDLVFEYFHRFPGDTVLLASVLKQCLRLRQYEYICQLLDPQELPLQPDAYTYTAHISALSKLGRLTEAREIFEEAVECGQGSIYVYNTMLDAYARLGDVAHSQEIWDRIAADGYAPNSVSYVGLMRAWGNQGSLAKARQLFDEMQYKGLKPMPHAFTILFDCITKKTEKIDMEWMMRLAESIEKEGIMNRHILSAMINAFSRQNLTDKHIQYVFVAFNRFRERQIPGNAVYSTLLQFCVRCEIPERSIEIWSMIKEDGFTPNGHVYSSLLKACHEIQNRSVSKTISNISKRLKADWMQHRSNKESQSQMVAAFNALLHFYAGIENREEVMSVYRSMQRHGPAPDRITCTTVLSAFTDVDRQSELTEEMIKSGFRPNAKTYGILLNTCSDAKDVNRAVRLLREMKQSGIEPTVECYTSVIDACVKEGSEMSIQLAFDYFQTLKDLGLQPTAVTYGCVLLAHAAQGDVDGAFRLYQEACRCGISPSDKCHNILINMCTDVGRLDDALELIKVLVRKHGDIAEETMNSLVRALSADYLPRALVLMRMMDNRPMAASSETLHCLMLACCRESSIQQAFAFYKEMIVRRLPVKQSAGSALIKTLGKAGEVLAALRVTNYMFEKAGLPSIDSASITKGWRKNPRPKPSRRNDSVVRTALPSVLSLGSLVMALALKEDLRMAMYLFRQICMLDDKELSGMSILAEDARQVFELLIELSCQANRVDWAIEVFSKWNRAAREMAAANQTDNATSEAKWPKISLASLAFLHATCKRTPGFESHIWSVCEAMRNQEMQRKGALRSSSLHRKQISF